MSDIASVDKGSKISRRDLLKLGVAALGGGILAVLGIREKLRNIQEKEGKIDMMLFTSKDSETNERTINFSLLKAVFPELIHQEKEGYSFINTGEKEVILDFKCLSGEKIRLGKNIIEAAISNIPWEEADKPEGKAEASCGLICRGDFTIRGNVNSQPEFVGEGLDRAIMFIGNGKELGQVEDIKFTGLNGYTKGEKKVAPSYIGADDINLKVRGIYIKNVVNTPEGVSEANAQLAKGISLHNSKNSHNLLMQVQSSLITGLEWDGIYSNGKTQIVLSKVSLIQDKKYRYRRGTAVAATFNSADGIIMATNLSWNYAKGARFYLNDITQTNNGTTNLDLENCSGSSHAWTLLLGMGDKTKLRGQKIIPDWGISKDDDLKFFPVEINCANGKVGLDFDNLEFTIDPGWKAGARLIKFDGLQFIPDLQTLGIRNFFEEKFDHFGGLIINVGNEKFDLSRDNLLKALSYIDQNQTVKLNPFNIELRYYLDSRQLVIYVSNYADRAKSVPSLAVFYINQNGELVDQVPE